MNECAVGVAKCSTYQQCVNLDGGYSCIGEFDPANKCDGTQCSAIQNCVPNAYTYQGYSCRDIDECLEGIHDCTVNQLCVNINYGSGYVCQGPADPESKCAPGSLGEAECNGLKATCSPDNSVEGYRCVDIDECANS